MSSPCPEVDGGNDRSKREKDIGAIYPDLFRPDTDGADQTAAFLMILYKKEIQLAFSQVGVRSS
jgi:hypothetical protein